MRSDQVVPGRLMSKLRATSISASASGSRSGVGISSSMAWMRTSMLTSCWALILFCATTMLSMPMMSSAIRCSSVCACGTGSLAEMTSTAPSMIAAPESIVAINVSWPGASTKETVRSGSLSPPSGHSSATV